MTNPETDKVFAGSIPKLYDTLLVPLIFEPYASDLAQRLAARSPARVLEIAAGTGVVTRKLAAALPESASIVATDLNQAMLDQAAAVETKRPVEWRQADAMQLPFEDAMFDAVVCQFGAMFFPDKAKALSEARRVLAPDGVFIFNVWDRIEENEFADTVTKALATLFPDAGRGSSQSSCYVLETLSEISIRGTIWLVPVWFHGEAYGYPDPEKHPRRVACAAQGKRGKEPPQPQ